LESQGGFVASDEQALQLSKEITTQAALSGVQIERYESSPAQQRHSLPTHFLRSKRSFVTVNTGEKELIDFLYNLAARGSLIRVKNMSLGPDPTRMAIERQYHSGGEFPKEAAQDHRRQRRRQSDQRSGQDESSTGQSPASARSGCEQFFKRERVKRREDKCDEENPNAT